MNTSTIQSTHNEIDTQTYPSGLESLGFLTLGMIILAGFAIAFKIPLD